MSTVINVRDMLFFLDAFASSPEGKSVKNSDPTHFNYWGASYGTIIGMTFASMFPARVNRLVLDGIADLDDYLSGRSVSIPTSADTVISSFFSYCFTAGRFRCPYYTGTSPTDIQNRFNSLFSKLNPKQAFAQGWENATAIGNHLEQLKIYLLDAVYQPITGFPVLAYQLMQIEKEVRGWESLTMCWRVRP